VDDAEASKAEDDESSEAVLSRVIGILGGLEPELDSQIDFAFRLEPVFRFVPHGKTAALRPEIGCSGYPFLPFFGRDAFHCAEAQRIEITGGHRCHGATSAVSAH
jgi:hypothetical protein